MTEQRCSKSTNPKNSLSRYSDGFRTLRFNFRRLWKLPDGYTASPALFGITLLTMTSLGVTLASWVMVRLLPNKELIQSLAAEFPDGFVELAGKLPELLAATQPSTTAITNVLVSQEAYIITYACGVATIFCFLLLVVALLFKW